MGALRATGQAGPDRAAAERAEPGQESGTRADPTAEPTTATIVWVDGTTAIVARWAGRPIVERVVSEVPAHHRSTGHIRHDPAIRHGGGGVATDQVERERLLRRAAHLQRVEDLVPETSDVQVLGPGLARMELAGSLRAADRRGRRSRHVATHASGRLTERQVVAILRSSVGEAPARRVVGRA
jgi:hypothetical protein